MGLEGSGGGLGLLTPNYIKKCIRMVLGLTPLSVPLWRGRLGESRDASRRKGELCYWLIGLWEYISKGHDWITSWGGGVWRKGRWVSLCVC